MFSVNVLLMHVLKSDVGTLQRLAHGLSRVE